MTLIEGTKYLLNMYNLYLIYSSEHILEIRITIPILQMRTARLREMKKFTQRSPARKWQKWYSDPGLSVQKNI